MNNLLLEAGSVLCSLLEICISIMSYKTVWWTSFFLHTLFQFDLTIAPIQNTGLINAKYNIAFYGTIIIWYNK